MAFTYDPDDLAAELNHLRFLVQDTTDEGHFFEDAEVTFASSQETNIYRAAANLCRAAAVKLSKTPSQDDATIKFEADKRAANYMALAKNYDKKANETDASMTNGDGGSMSFPTLSVEDKDPSFTRDLHFS